MKREKERERDERIGKGERVACQEMRIRAGRPLHEGVHGRTKREKESRTDCGKKKDRTGDGMKGGWYMCVCARPTCTCPHIHTHTRA